MPDDKRLLLRQRLASGQIRLQPLTYPQRELWETSPVPVADMANHICCLIEIRGKLAREEVAAALGQVVLRQEALRTSFLPGKERPLQMIREQTAPNIRFRNLSAEEGLPEGVEIIAHEIFAQPFDLLQGPLYRIELLSRNESDHVLVFAIHHAIADGWTLGVFVQELCLAYIQRLRGAVEALPPVSQSYSAWGAAERALWPAGELAQRAAYWKKQLAGYQRLWAQFEGAHTASGAPARMVTHLPDELATGLRELARRSGATLFSTLLAGFQIALSRWTGSEDILVGTPVANRTKQAINETMGYFAGIVPLRHRIEPKRSFLGSVRAVHESTMEGFAQAMPFVELARALEDPGSAGENPAGHNPIFEVRFALQNHPVPDISFPGLSAKLRMRSTGTARFHLACEITEESTQLEVVWLFRPTLFAQGEVEDLCQLFRMVLSHACLEVETRLAEIAR